MLTRVNLHLQFTGLINYIYYMHKITCMNRANRGVLPVQRYIFQRILSLLINKLCYRICHYDFIQTIGLIFVGLHWQLAGFGLVVYGIYLATKKVAGDYAGIFDEMDTSMWEALVGLMITLGILVLSAGILGSFQGGFCDPCKDNRCFWLCVGKPQAQLS